MPLSQGDRLGRYEVLGPIGAGGMGEVWRARDTELGREVAVKVLPEEVASEPRRVERFRREARALAALSHPNLLEIHDVGSSNGLDYVVTELLEGDSQLAAIPPPGLPWQNASLCRICTATSFSSRFGTAPSSRRSCGRRGRNSSDELWWRVGRASFISRWTPAAGGAAFVELFGPTRSRSAPTARQRG